MLPHSSPRLGENRTDERGQKNVTWKLPDIEKTANACSHRSISDRLIGGISSLPPLALRGSLCVRATQARFPIGRYTCPEGRGTRAISDNFNGAVYRDTYDGARVGRWHRVAEGRLCAGQASEDRRIMATCREQHKTMPDRVVKAQALPDMKERTKRVENAPDREKP